MMNIGFDLDGVICKYDAWASNQITKESIKRIYFLEMPIQLNPKEFVLPEDNLIIITARPTIYSNVTKAWLEFHGIKCEVIFIGNKRTELSPEHAAIKKAAVINDRNIEVFFEDNPTIVAELRKRTDAKIIYVKSHPPYEDWK